MISFAVRYIKYAIVGLTALSCCAEATAETVELSSAGDSYIFENKRCSEVDTREITVGGRPFDATRDRLSIYGNGAIVIADGWTEPLTIYSEPGCQGPSRVLERDRFYRGELQSAESFLPEELLGDFDNGVRSFRLKRGFSCTMANNPDGTGYSRVYIAADDDIVVNTMPDGLDFVSFIRVCRHDWVGKRGVSGGDLSELTRSAWFYDWGASAVSTDNCEYIPMRHNRWWDGWDNIGSRTNTSCVLGFNEPDHADQSDLGTEIAIEMWPEFMKSGLRIGSPAPDNISKDWLREFLAKADSLNYRVDFVATHMYLASQDPYTLANTINRLCRESYGGRPMWITEWNNGANWTNERWPDQKGPQRDADFNIIYDADGNTTEVARPHTPANSEVQCAWLAKALDAFDKCDRPSGAPRLLLMGRGRAGNSHRRETHPGRESVRRVQFAPRLQPADPVPAPLAHSAAANIGHHLEPPARPCQFLRPQRRDGRRLYRRAPDRRRPMGTDRLSAPRH